MSYGVQYRIGLVVALGVGVASACVVARPVASLESPGAASEQPPLERPSDPDQARFESRVLPILHERCQPCHFPGGTMYTRMPFDQPGTIRVLGTDLFSRIRDTGEQAVIRAFLEGIEEPLQENQNENP